MKNSDPATIAFLLRGVGISPRLRNKIAVNPLLPPPPDTPFPHPDGPLSSPILPLSFPYPSPTLPLSFPYPPLSLAYPSPIPPLSFLYPPLSLPYPSLTPPLSIPYPPLSLPYPSPIPALPFPYHSPIPPLSFSYPSERARSFAFGPLLIPLGTNIGFERNRSVRISAPWQLRGAEK